MSKNPEKSDAHKGKVRVKEGIGRTLGGEVTQRNGKLENDQASAQNADRNSRKAEK